MSTEEPLVIQRLPPFIAACCLLVYWGAVVSKALRAMRKQKQDVNLIPRERTGRWLRLIWIPAIVAWCVQPWLALRTKSLAGIDPLGLVVGFAGAGVCLGATIATFSCWREMGKSWRIGINPSEKTKLIFTGPYRIVRHPIYALSILLIWGTLATTRTPMMLFLTLLHSILMQWEARREEAYLLEKHGDAYAEYMKRVGRFFPRAQSYR